MTHLPDEKPLAVDERGCSALTGISIPTLQRHRVTGEGIPFVKIGRMVRYRRADIEAFMASRVVSSTSAAA